CLVCLAYSVLDLATLSPLYLLSLHDALPISEMRERILNALRAAQQPQPEEAHKRQTWQLARAALTHAENRGWHLLQNPQRLRVQDRKSTRLNSSHVKISYAVFCLKKKKSI